jgi:hypothetical protein
MSKIIITLLVLAITSALAPQARAQAAPAIGTLTTVGSSFPCSQARNGSKFLTNMTCQNATVSNCAGAADLNLTYGWIGPLTPTGTIVLFSGGSGTAPTEDGDNIPLYAPGYATNYEVVEFEWDSTPWEDPSSPNGGSFLTAACRPATFLNFVNSAASGLNPTNATCAQGESMGTAAITYSMAWYGQNYLKAVELIAGPPVSEMDIGCNPSSGTATLCGAGTTYCSPATALNPWTDRESYPPAHASDLSNWSGLPGCSTSGITQAELQQYAAMSIVDGSFQDYHPNFNYKPTPVHGYLCTDSYQQNSCTGLNCPNNTSAEAGFFYNAVSAAEGGVQNYNLLEVTGTLSCAGAEGVDQGTDPDLGGMESTRIMTEMSTRCHK